MLVFEYLELEIECRDFIITGKKENTATLAGDQWIQWLLLTENIICFTLSNSHRQSMKQVFFLPHFIDETKDQRY